MLSVSTKRAIKQAIVAFRLTAALGTFIMASIQIHLALVGSGTYPPASVSMLICSLLQASWCTVYFTLSGRGPLFVARTALITTVLFSTWQLVSTSYTTSQRYTGRYCGPTSKNREVCSRGLKATISLGYCLFAAGLINIISIVELVKTSESVWQDYLHDLPADPKHLTDPEMAADQ